MISSVHNGTHGVAESVSEKFMK